jgi:hypothetical protein
MIHDRFISEPLTPVASTCDTARMATGEPGLPKQFRWRDGTIDVVAVLDAWRETGPCHHGSGEKYARKHWYQIQTPEKTTMKIYFERQARGGRKVPRWWLFSIAEEQPDPARQGSAEAPEARSG